MNETKPLLCSCLHSYCSRSGLYWWGAFSHGKGNTSRDTMMLQSVSTLLKKAVQGVSRPLSDLGNRLELDLIPKFL